MHLLRWTILLVAFFSLVGQAKAQDNNSANAIDKYFKQYVEDERFTVVYISSKLFEIIGKLDVEGVDFDDKEAELILDLAKDTKGLRILVTEEDTQALFAEAKSKINTSEYEVLMTVRNHDDSDVEFLVKDENDTIKELLLLVGGDEEFVLLSFVGNLDLNKISNLAKEIEN